ncbi:MAG: hypothetical protein AABY22_17355 [Nanoarchaeota archaeon]
MIDFNENDYNITEIKKESKLFNLATKYSYRVYGLIKQNNPVIYIQYNQYSLNLREPELLNQVEEFLHKNSLPVEIWNNRGQNNKIGIGLRRDLRDHVVLSAAVIQTIIYGIEGRIDFDNRKIPGIPKFNVE